MGSFPPSLLTKEHGARLEDKIFGASSSKLQAPSLTSFKLQDIMGVEREGNMIIDRTPTEGAVRISSSINNHLVTRVYYFMTEEEAIESFKEEFHE